MSRAKSLSRKSGSKMHRRTGSMTLGRKSHQGAAEAPGEPVTSTGPQMVTATARAQLPYFAADPSVAALAQPTRNKRFSFNAKTREKAEGSNREKELGQRLALLLIEFEERKERDHKLILALQTEKNVLRERLEEAPQAAAEAFRLRQLLHSDIPPSLLDKAKQDIKNMLFVEASGIKVNQRRQTMMKLDKTKLSGNHVGHLSRFLAEPDAQLLDAMMKNKHGDDSDGDSSTGVEEDEEGEKQEHQRDHQRDEAEGSSDDESELRSFEDGIRETPPPHKSGAGRRTRGLTVRQQKLKNLTRSSTRPEEEYGAYNDGEESSSEFLASDDEVEDGEEGAGASAEAERQEGPGATLTPTKPRRRRPSAERESPGMERPLKISEGSEDASVEEQEEEEEEEEEEEQHHQEEEEGHAVRLATRGQLEELREQLDEAEGDAMAAYQKLGASKEKATALQEELQEAQRKLHKKDREAQLLHEHLSRVQRAQEETQMAFEKEKARVSSLESKLEQELTNNHENQLRELKQQNLELKEDLDRAMSKLGVKDKIKFVEEKERGDPIQAKIMEDKERGDPIEAKFTGEKQVGEPLEEATPEEDEEGIVAAAAADTAGQGEEEADAAGVPCFDCKELNPSPCFFCTHCGLKQPPSQIMSADEVLSGESVDEVLSGESVEDAPAEQSNAELLKAHIEVQQVFQTRFEDEASRRAESDKRAAHLEAQLRSVQEELAEETRLRTEADRELADTRAALALSEQQCAALDQANASTVKNIEGIYKQQNKELQAKIKSAQRERKENKVAYEIQLKKAMKKLQQYKGRIQELESEAEQLRDRAFELQESQAEAQAAPASLPGNVTTFDMEGQYQTLYKETLTALHEERQQRRDLEMTQKTRLQNLREELEDERDSVMAARERIEVLKTREQELSATYRQELQVERQKEKQMELDLLEERNENKWKEQVEKLERTIQEMKQGADFSGVQADHDKDKELLIEKNIAVLEENDRLRERTAQFEWLREKYFFSSCLAVKLSESLAGNICNLDAAALWPQARQVPLSQWQAWLQDLLVDTI